MPYWDLFLFVQISFKTCLARAWQRNSEQSISEETLRQRYQTRYIPAQRHYLATCRPTERADIILYNDEVDRLRVAFRESQASSDQPPAPDP